ncbi:MAG: class I mannose-6-phosphate isomerase [Lacticaseibacillus paracasei]
MKAYGATSNETGSVYSVAATQGLDCGYLDADSGKEGNLYTLTQKEPELLGLKHGEVYPLIVDMLGADKDLSIQVHPQDDYARQRGFDYGKSESWYFLEAPTSGSVYGGIQDDKINTLTDDGLSQDPLGYVGTVEAKVGDYLFVPSGTVHAIQAGSLVYEIQQATDITYRIYDYDRRGLDGKPRELHVKDALANLIATNKPIHRDFKRTGHADEQAYTLDLLAYNSKNQISNPTAMAAVFTLISGSLKVQDTTLYPGSSFMLLPHEDVLVKGDAQGILATPKAYWRE